MSALVGGNINRLTLERDINLNFVIDYVTKM